MGSSKLVQDAMSEAWADVCLLAYSISHSFAPLDNGDVTEMIGRAQLHFLDAFHDYDEEKNDSFERYVAYRIRCGLMDYTRGLKYRRATLKQIPADFKSLATKENGSIWQEILLDATRDIKYVLKIIYDPPTDLHWAFRRGGETARNALRKYLTYHKSWRVGRIDFCFDYLTEWSV